MIVSSVSKVGKVLRVGGHLDHADVQFVKKQQFILSAKGKICWLIGIYYYKNISI